MSRLISPLDDTIIRLDAAVAMMAQHEPSMTADSLLELLVRAMWQGRFEPSDEIKHARPQPDAFKDPNNWLRVPIVAPVNHLTPEQMNLDPRPYEYFEAGRGTIISVMLTEELLPGSYEQWDKMIWPCGIAPGDRAEAFDALIRMPLAKYSYEARAFFGSLYIPRAMLQNWLDLRTSKFQQLFYPLEVPPGSKPATKENKSETTPQAPTKLGRPSYVSEEFIRSRAIAIKLANPSMRHKIIAYKVHQDALAKFSDEPVLSESTIYHRLCEYFKGLDLNHSKPN